MSLEKAKAHLDRFSLSDRIRLFEVSSATVALAAAALGTEEARIAKTISLDTPDGTVLLVTAGDVKISNSKYKQHFHTKARMLGFDTVEEKTGHAVGGVCPFGNPDGVRVYLDNSLRRFDKVYPAAGTPSSAVELTVPELELASSFVEWVDVTEPITKE